MTDDDSNTVSILLEEPPPAESPGSFLAGASGLEMGDGTLATQAQKLAIHESVLSLLVKPLSFQDFMRDLLLCIVRVVKCEAGSILEMNEPEQVLFFRAVSGRVSDTVSKFTIPLGQGIVGHVAESRQPVVEDSPKDNMKHLKVIQDAVGFEANNLIAVPIVIRGKVYGVLELINRMGEEKFSVADLDLLRYICDVSAKAIETRLMLGYALKDKQADKLDKKDRAA